MDAQPVPGLTIARGVTVTSTGERRLDDLAFAAEIGLTHVRLDVPWVLAQPKAGTVDGGVMEELVATAQEARRLGLLPWFRLLQPQVPNWFDDDGGFTDDATAGLWWPRWVEAVAGHLGGVAAGWVPFEAPYGMVQRLAPDDGRRQGELFNTLMVAWRDAWRILRGGPPVATSLDVADERPTGPSQAHLDAARRREHLRWNLWLHGLTRGVVDIPGRARIELPDLAGACDIVGVAVRRKVGEALHRCADQGPERPLAITFRPPGTTDSECAAAIAEMWREVHAASSGITIAGVTSTPFLDGPDGSGTLGLATATRRLKDTGEAFIQSS